MCYIYFNNNNYCWSVVKNGEVMETNYLVTVLLWAAACEVRDLLMNPYSYKEFHITMQIAEGLKCVCIMAQMDPLVIDYYFY